MPVSARRPAPSRRRTASPARRAGTRRVSPPTAVDLVRERPSEYSTPSRPTWIRTARSKVLAVDGTDRPAGAGFQAAIRALYGTCYTVKFALKRRGEDFRVPPLQGIWHLAGPPKRRSPSLAGARWTLQLPVPSFVRAEDVRAAGAALAERRGEGTIAPVELRASRAGRAVQLLHVGPYSAEGPDLTRMEAFARSSGARIAPYHLEVYLSDPRRTPPARLRTILRKPALP